jgi:hypothetical protein
MKTILALVAALTLPVHVVHPGETLGGIAAARHLTVAQLRAWNGAGVPSSPRTDTVLNLARPAKPLTGWRTRVAAVAPAEKNPRCPAELRKVWVTYIDFFGVARNGSIIVNKAIVARTQNAFHELYRMRFRIQAMQPVTVNAPYLTDFEAITRSYECRTVAGTKTVSQHAYGLAIDVNPIQNPMIRGDYLDPPAGVAYTNRGFHRRGMIHPAGAERAFTANGFHWGGRWKSLKDYMHFSTTNK